jgi:hypothetical protein
MPGVLKHFLSVCVCIPLVARAQTQPPEPPPDSSKPSGCYRLVESEANRFFRELSAKGGKFDDSVGKVLSQRQRDMAKRFVRRFPIASVDATELSSLASLYRYVDEPDSMIVIARRRLSLAKSTSERSAALRAIVYAFDERGAPSRDSARKLDQAYLDSAEHYVAQLDALGTPAAFDRSNAHVNMTFPLPKWEQVERRRHHMQKALAAVREVTGDERSRRLSEITSVHTSYAFFLLEYESLDSVRTFVERSLAELNDTSMWNGLKQLRPIGRPTPELVASNWFNAPPGFKEIEPQGKVTLLMITATW